MPAAAEMAYLVRTSSRRFGREQSLPDPLPERGPAFEQLKAHYQGWAAVQWVEEHGEQVADITAFHDGTRVRAGNSLDKRLWRERILYVTPLQGYYRLPSRLWQWVLRAGVAAGHFPAVVAPEAVTAPAEPAAHPLSLIHI